QYIVYLHDMLGTESGKLAELLLCLNVCISSSGSCSRQQADRYITGGSGTVNGNSTTKKRLVSKSDKVYVTNDLIQLKENSTYIMLNKPRGIICTAAKNVPENIIDYVNYPERIFPVGRLDKHSEGLIILTNDGPIVNEFLNQDYLVEKEYLVTV